MAKQTDLMNQYVADLGVLNVKLHNLHWNVVGERFKPVHEYVEELYDMVFETYDEVAERMKMLGDYPLASLKKYLEVTKVDELEEKDFQIPEVYAILKQDLEHLKNLATNIRAVADEADDFATVAMMEDQVNAYDKELWFIAQALK
ncbi:MAG: Dps family protein [Bacillota bacterium]